MQVFADALVQQRRVLRNDPNHASEFVRGHRRYVRIAHGHHTRLRRVEAHQQIRHRGLPGSGGTDDGKKLARFHFEAHIAQRRLAVIGIGEGNAAERHTRRAGRRGSAAVGRCVGWIFQQRRHPPPRRQQPVQHRVEVQHEPQRGIEEHGRQHKGRQRARRGAPAGGFGNAHGKDQQQADAARRHPHVVLVARQRRNPIRAFGQQPLVQFAQARPSMFLGLRGADKAAARDGLLRERANRAGELSLGLQGGLFTRRDEAPNHQQDRRQRQHRRRHPPVEHEGRNQRAGKLDSPEEALHDQVLCPVTRLLRISNESVGQLPAGLPVEKAPVAANHPGKDVGAQVLVRAHQSALAANPVRDDSESMKAVGAADGQHQDHDQSDFPSR